MDSLINLFCLVRILFSVHKICIELPAELLTMCFDLIALLCPGVPDKLEAEIMEKIHPPHLGLERTLVHGYPYKPTAMAFDPVQKVLAIGNKEGTIKVFGKRGIDLTFQHESKRYNISTFKFKLCNRMYCIRHVCTSILSLRIS